jgi:hypothetical protein
MRQVHRLVTIVIKYAWQLLLKIKEKAVAQEL